MHQYLCTGPNRTQYFLDYSLAHKKMRFVSCNKELFRFHSLIILFPTKSCHPYIGSNIASNGIKHLLSIKIMIPHKLHLQTVTELRIKNNFRID